MLGELLVGLTRVEIVKKRNTEAACKGCHALIDPIGIGFVQFDHTGRFDATIDGAEYGVAPRCPTRSANARVRRRSPSWRPSCRRCPRCRPAWRPSCSSYTEGREPVRADTCAVEAASKSFASGGNDFAAMLTGLVDAAQPSALRRAAGATP